MGFDIKNVAAAFPRSPEKITPALETLESQILEDGRVDPAELAEIQKLRAELWTKLSDKDKRIFDRLLTSPRQAAGAVQSVLSAQGSVLGNADGSRLELFDVPARSSAPSRVAVELRGGVHLDVALDVAPNEKAAEVAARLAKAIEERTNGGARVTVQAENGVVSVDILVQAPDRPFELARTAFAATVTTAAADALRHFVDQRAGRSHRISIGTSNVARSPVGWGVPSAPDAERWGLPNGGLATVLTDIDQTFPGRPTVKRQLVIVSPTGDVTTPKSIPVVDLAEDAFSLHVLSNGNVLVGSQAVGAQDGKFGYVSVVECFDPSGRSVWQESTYTKMPLFPWFQITPNGEVVVMGEVSTRANGTRPAMKVYSADGRLLG